MEKKKGVINTEKIFERKNKTEEKNVKERNLEREGDKEK